MGARALRGNLLGIDEVELMRLVRAGAALLLGTPSMAYGSSPRRLRSGRGLEFLDHADYAVGDDPRAIDWRATARARRPIVRRHQDEAFFSVHLCLDGSASMRVGGASKWELARRVALALAYLLLQAGNRVGVLTFSTGVDRARPPARGPGAFVSILASLAETEARPEGGGTRLEGCAALVEAGSSVIVMSDFLAPDGLRSGLDLLLLRRCHVQAIQILSPQETSIPVERTLWLRDVETGHRRRVRIDPAAHEAARRRLESHSESLRRHCRGRGIPLSQCTSTSSWRDVLLAHLRALERFRA